ncbi:hypothetical protein DFH09DRAFT_1088313 [Mycena vulgaris]|nr:hypothetical protein DFH09DRAFT_1088313 [Mycena vulgaris]
MFCTTPLDVVLLILRLLMICDVLALFATCRQLHKSGLGCRPFWVYININVDKLPCSPGRPRINYSTWETADLRAQAMRAWRVHEAWRTLDHRPVAIHTLRVPLEYNAPRIIPIPWSRLVVRVGTTGILLQDWRSKETSEVAVPSECLGLVVCSASIFWVESIESNVLIPHMLMRRAGPTNSELLYKIDIEAGSVSYLVHLNAPGGLVQLDLHGNYLAAICHSRGQIITLHSFELKFSPDVAVLPKLVIRLNPRDPVSHSLFTILSLGRFLIAGHTGISIYEIPEEAFTQPNGRTWWRLLYLCTPAPDYNYEL